MPLGSLCQARVGPPFPKDKMALGPKAESVERSLKNLGTPTRGEVS